MMPACVITTPPPNMREHLSESGFTLIELSIVLVIIGLIVGGVLVGQSLIAAAQVRATVTQIEQYNTAANTFRGKYGALPGDIAQNLVTQFGFTVVPTRPGTPGQGDGNGVLEGYSYFDIGIWDFAPLGGETAWFWEDLSANSHLIDQTFNTEALGNNAPVDQIIPKAKLGGGNYIYVYSFNGTNYFGLSMATGTTVSGSQSVLYGSTTTPGLTVQQAYAIDSKVDDGLPQSGNVTAKYQNWNLYPSNFSLNIYGAFWAQGGGVAGPYGTAANPGSTTTCYDNSNSPSGTPGISGAVQHYSIEISNGANNNCALSFKMQAGD